MISEFGIFRNVLCLASSSPGTLSPFTGQGCIITPYIQGLVWGKMPSSLLGARFSGGLFNAPSIKLAAVYAFPGAIRYLGKPPHRGRSVYRRFNGTMGRQPWPNMSLTLHHLFLRNLHQFCCPELTFGSGEGSAVLAHAKRLWRDYQPGATAATDDRPPLFSGLVKRRHR